MNLGRLASSLADLADSLEKASSRRRVEREYERNLKSGYFDDQDDEEDDYDDDDYDDDDIPVGCRACGGDYPNCADSCPLFD